MTLDDYIAALERLRRRHGGSIEVAWVAYDDCCHWHQPAPKPKTVRAGYQMTDLENPDKRVVIVASPWDADCDWPDK